MACEGIFIPKSKLLSYTYLGPLHLKILLPYSTILRPRVIDLLDQNNLIKNKINEPVYGPEYNKKLLDLAIEEKILK